LAAEGLLPVMLWHPLSTYLPDYAAIEIDDVILPQPGLLLYDPPAQYRPRHPEKTAVYQLFQNHFDDYVQVYEERFESRSGPLRPVVVHSVEEFLACGRLQGDFARIRCPKCRVDHLLAFSCRTRGGLCSSCQAKRALLFAEKLTGESKE